MRFKRFSIAALALTLVVIVWGAFVRASGSGAGCGDHWPQCNGQMILQNPSTHTMIEYTHRFTSGLALIAVLILAVSSLRSGFASLHSFELAKPDSAPRTSPISSRARGGAWWALFFMVTEALIGRYIVKAELVANNASASRALGMSIHLLNTFFLLWALSVCCLHAHLGLSETKARSSIETVASILSRVLLLAVGVSGAIAALGDTLVQQAVVSPVTDALVQLRIIHPLLAIAGVLSALWLIRASQNTVPARWLAALAAALVAQVLCGLLNVVLMAPTYMQLVHLFLADVVWMLLVCVGELQRVKHRNLSASVLALQPS
jgi:heme a synthase